MSWTRITPEANIPVRQGRAVQIGAEEIAIFNLGQGKFLAVDNRCPHQGGPLADGIVSGDTVVCPLHGWKICLDSGKIQKPDLPVCVQTYPVRAADGIISIDLSAKLGQGAAA